MRYYVMEPTGTILLPAVPKGENPEIVLASDLNRFSDIDYDLRSELISDRLKLLMERYLPRYDFRPVVYLEKAKLAQMVFWRFKPPHYADYQATFRSDGVLAHISFFHNKAPVVFTAQSPRGIRSIAVRMAVAESTLRRGIFGVKFSQISEATTIFEVKE